MTVAEKKTKARREYEAFMHKGTCPVCDWQSNRQSATGKLNQLLNHIFDEHWEVNDDKINRMINEAVKRLYP